MSTQCHLSTRLIVYICLPLFVYVGHFVLRRCTLQVHLSTCLPALLPKYVSINGWRVYGGDMTNGKTNGVATGFGVKCSCQCFSASLSVCLSLSLCVCLSLSLSLSVSLSLRHAYTQAQKNLGSKHKCTRTHTHARSTHSCHTCGQ